MIGSKRLLPSKVSNSTGPVSSATALAANSARLGGFVQNLGTNVLYVKEGAGASASDFSAILSPCTVQDDGFGGVHNLGEYVGIVTIAGTSPRYVAVERT